MSELQNKRHERFCIEYLVDLNGAAAYRRAGYSATSAKSKACDLLKRPEVQDRIAELEGERNQRVKVDADLVLREIATIAMSDITKFVQVSKGTVLITDTDELDEATRRSIQSISQTKHGIAVRFHSKTQALDMLGKYLGMFSDINVAIATLEKYGIKLRQTEAGWEVDAVTNP